MKTYLSSIAYNLGNFYSIEEINELRDKPEVLESLLTLGLDKYSKSNLTTLEMARESGIQTLDKANISGKEIDVLIYATYSLWDFQSSPFVEIGHLIHELGLKNAYPIGTFLSGCGNLQTAIRIATNLIRGEECKNILIITADKFSENTSRLVQPNVSVLSDAAASCLITNDEVQGGFEVLSTNQVMNSEISYFDPIQHSLEIFERILAGSQKAFQQALQAIDKESNHFRLIITNNYNLSVTKSLCANLDFYPDQAYTDNIPRFAHASAADNLINLHDLSVSNPLFANDLILLLGTGPMTWGCTVLSKT
ncbi:3-oxoacyl-[acyl-carrier-protein] synthase III C-terminal domain-containing protein [Nostoc sp. UHCC 0926]|uniref:3-oxoacyl-[acyl-carrier-protein] synthase III C-terminal domain-containing protein n=1 Tax=Nostoc sp. UHCC 0926 TaxID=3025190 RepID=UPI002361824E|nr:3-oxoacyl-[acyl-carrier-protein] synthase III C-terminal domain-containing protein [Nostoc sp. UHCC 0926]